MSDEVQKLLEQAQVYQQQMQGVITQKEALSMQAMEIARALEELKKSKETEVYKLSGPVLIKSNKADVEKDLKEKKETIDLRIKTLEKSETRLKEKVEELRKKLTDASRSGVKAGG
jgi:prefoldin beta subunit